MVSTPAVVRMCRALSTSIQPCWVTAAIRGTRPISRSDWAGRLLQLFVSEKGAEVDAFISAGMGQGRPFDYVIDAIDSLQPKVELIRSSLKHRIPIVSSMGAGGRLDPAAVVSCDLSQLQWDRETIRWVVDPLSVASLQPGQCSAVQCSAVRCRCFGSDTGVAGQRRKVLQKTR
jgi:hypothetical protein